MVLLCPAAGAGADHGEGTRVKQLRSLEEADVRPADRRWIVATLALVVSGSGVAPGGGVVATAQTDTP